MIYVDDFKMAGPADAVKACWELLRKDIKMSDPEQVNHVLGCSHKIGSHSSASGTAVRTMTYDMKSFFEQCIVNYEELAGPGFELSNANTPFVEEDDRDNPFPCPTKGRVGIDMSLVCSLLQARCVRACQRRKH